MLSRSKVFASSKRRNAGENNSAMECIYSRGMKRSEEMKVKY